MYKRIPVVILANIPKIFVVISEWEMFGPSFGKLKKDHGFLHNEFNQSWKPPPIK